MLTALALQNRVGSHDAANILEPATGSQKGPQPDDKI